MNNEDYVLKSKYSRLLNSLSQIKREMETIQSVLKDVYNLSNNAVKVDNKCVENENFNRLKDMTGHYLNNISRTIDRVQSKI